MAPVMPPVAPPATDAQLSNVMNNLQAMSGEPTPQAPVMPVQEPPASVAPVSPAVPSNTVDQNANAATPTIPDLPKDL